MSPGSPAIAGGRAFAALGIGMAAWLLVMTLTWPEALSFGDDVGYVGEAKLLLAGRISPRPEDAGVWARTPHGLVPQYPLLPSLLLAPLLAITPRAVFALSILAALVTCGIAGRVLRGWETEPVWGLVVLAHPTVIVLARTAMADLPLSALALGGWWTLRQNRRISSAVLFGALFAAKPLGFVLGLALAFGESLRLLPAIRARDPDARRRAVTTLVSLAAGFATVFLTNEISVGRLWFAYDHHFLGTPPFWPSYFPKTAPAHARTLLLFPPLLIAGAWPWWRRRELGPLCLIVGVGTMMCFYFFVDYGTSRIESLVLSPRLILPVLVFLLIGYADLLARIVRRLAENVRSPGFMPAPLLVAGTTAIAAVVAVRHARWQAPMGDARVAAQRIATDIGSRELSIFPQAAKVGLLFPGPTPLVSARSASAPVVLCSNRSASYRSPRDGAYSCEIRGYHTAYQGGDFEVLVRGEGGAGARGADGGRRNENDLWERQK